MTTPTQPAEKSLGQIAAEAFGYKDWLGLSASLRADFQRAAEAVEAEIYRRRAAAEAKARATF